MGEKLKVQDSKKEGGKNNRIKYQKDQTFNPYFRIAYEDRHMSTSEHNLMLFVSIFLVCFFLFFWLHWQCASIYLACILDGFHSWDIYNYSSLCACACALLTNLSSCLTWGNNYMNPPTIKSTASQSATCAELQFYLLSMRSFFSFSISPNSWAHKCVQNIHALCCTYALAKGSKILRFDGRKIFIK